MYQSPPPRGPSEPQGPASGFHGAGDGQPSVPRVRRACPAAHKYFYINTVGCGSRRTGRATAVPGPSTRRTKEPPRRAGVPCRTCAHTSVPTRGGGLAQHAQPVGPVHSSGLLAAGPARASLPVQANPCRARGCVAAHGPRGRGCGWSPGPRATSSVVARAPGRRACLTAASALVFLCPAAEPRCWSVRGRLQGRCRGRGREGQPRGTGKLSTRPVLGSHFRCPLLPLQLQADEGETAQPFPPSFCTAPCLRSRFWPARHPVGPGL